MSALTQDRNTSRRDGNQVEPPVAATTRIWGGSIVCINAGGYAVPGATATTLKAVGVAEGRADNSAGVAGAIRVRCRKGPHRFANSAAADAIALTPEEWARRPWWVRVAQNTARLADSLL